MVILTVIVSFTNFLTPQTKAENFGEKSLLYTLATGENLEEEYIQEEVGTASPKISANYLEGQNSGVTGSADISFEGLQIDQEPQIPMTSDNSALVKPEIPSIEVAQKYRDKPIEYTVQPGDSISSIAQNFGISSETIMWENNLTKFSYIRPGQKLVILPTSGVSYKVASGDTLDKIAKKYNVDKQKILEFNRLADQSEINTGMILIIPEGHPYQPPVKTQPQLASIKQIFENKIIKVPLGDKMAWPTTARRISQYFSWRHIGLDIDGDFGDPVWAADDGVVIKSICLKTGYGCHVIIDHGNGKTTLYGHFQKLYVKEGQKVVRGEVLGEEGSTGHSTGSHLHFEVRFGGKRYNPLSYIK